jgi:thiol-disulfide isomerase/thioredoxin
VIGQQGLGRSAGAIGRRMLFALAAVLAPLSVCLADEPTTPPPCALTLTAGQLVSFDAYRGQVLYVDFWASWCGPCQLSFPFMNELQRAYGARGLHVLAINMDEKPADAARFLDQHPASFDIANGPNGRCAKDFGVATMPTSYLVDRKGTIRVVHKGFRAGDIDELRGKLEELIAESAPGSGAQ